MAHLFNTNHSSRNVVVAHFILHFRMTVMDIFSCATDRLFINAAVADLCPLPFTLSIQIFKSFSQFLSNKPARVRVKIVLNL